MGGAGNTHIILPRISLTGKKKKNHKEISQQKPFSKLFIFNNIKHHECPVWLNNLCSFWIV